MFHINVAIVQLLVLVLCMTVIHVILNNESNSVHEANVQENIESHDYQEKQNELLHTGNISKQHANITKEVHELYTTIEQVLKADGGIEGHIDKESAHYNRSHTNSDILNQSIQKHKENGEKLDKILSLLNSSS